MSGADYCCERKCLRSPRTVVDGRLRCGCFSWCKCSCAKNLAVKLTGIEGIKPFSLLQQSAFASSLKRAPLVAVAEGEKQVPTVTRTGSMDQRPSTFDRKNVGEDRCSSASARPSTGWAKCEIGNKDDQTNNNPEEMVNDVRGPTVLLNDEQTINDRLPRPFPRRRYMVLPKVNVDDCNRAEGQRPFDGHVDNEGYCGVPADVPFASKSSPSHSICRVYDRKPESDVVYRGVRCRCGLWLNNSSPLVFVSPCGHHFCDTCANMFDRCFTCHALITGRVSTSVERIL